MKHGARAPGTGKGFSPGPRALAPEIERLRQSLAQHKRAAESISLRAARLAQLVSRLEAQLYRRAQDHALIKRTLTEARALEAWLEHLEAAVAAAEKLQAGRRRAGAATARKTLAAALAWQERIRPEVIRRLARGQSAEAIALHLAGSAARSAGTVARFVRSFKPRSKS